MFQSLEFLLLSCLFLTLESRKDQVPEPQNVKLEWINGFEAQLSWEPPLPNCTYTVTSNPSEISEARYKEKVSPWEQYFLMEGGSLKFIVQTVCNGKSSEGVTIGVQHPELVKIKNLQCYVHAAKQTYCSWSPASPALDPRFFYRLTNQNGSVSVNDKGPVIIKECPKYTFTNGVRTGCNLEAGVDNDVHVLFNGTVNGAPVWNTFRKQLLYNVRAPPLNWTVTKTDNQFQINWTHPDIPGHWTFVVFYTECKDKNKTKDAHDGETSVVLDLVPHCPYRIYFQGRRDPGGETEWSEAKEFAANVDPAAWVYAAIIIPLVFAGLVVLIILCCRKNKDIIFPKVPEPLDLISDISDNNNKITVRNLYIPVEEEESCKITLVTEP